LLVIMGFLMQSHGMSRGSVPEALEPCDVARWAPQIAVPWVGLIRPRTRTQRDMPTAPGWHRVVKPQEAHCEVRFHPRAEGRRPRPHTTRDQVLA